MSDSCFPYPKTCRLLTQQDFSRAFDQPRRIKTAHFTFLYKKNNRDVARLGIIIAKKQIRHAVDRNRIKRLSRESFRKSRQRFPGIDMILLAYKGIEQLENKEIVLQLEELWKKLNAF